MILLDETDVDLLASPQLGLEAARQAASLSAGGVTTSRVQVGDGATWMRVLAGIIPSMDLLGYKEFHRVGQRVRYHVSVFERSTGDCVGIVDGRRITSLRTASTAALAFTHFFGEEPVTLGVIGSGEEAKEGLRAMATAVRLAGVRAFSPTVVNREAFATQLGAELGLAIEPVGSLAAALEGASAAYVATSAVGSPFLAFHDVRHLRFLGAIGSTRPEQRELVGDVLAGAGAVIIDCPDARHEPGDVIEAAQRYGWDASKARLLGDYLAGPPQTPASSSGLVVFKSIGSVEQDLVLARALLTAARRQDAGREVEPIGSLRIMR